MRRILWFRRDLRCDDHPLLALEGEVLPVFIFDSNILSRLCSDDRRVTFLFQTLMRLKQKLRGIGRELALFYGDPEEVFEWLLGQERFDEVCASGDYDSYATERDRKVSHLLTFRLIRDTYIFHPDEVVKPDATPYLVFTPFYNRAKTLFTPAHMGKCPLSSQSILEWDYGSILKIENRTAQTLPLSLRSIGFTPAALTPRQQQTPEEKLDIFAAHLAAYRDTRDFPAMEATSALSIDLRFGTLSVRALLRWLSERKKAGIETEPFFRQLIFREFYAMLLYHFPRLEQENFRYPFHGIGDQERFEAFCNGRTGVPIVDAGIRELLETGEIPNRARMICASFFTKNLLLPWQWGEAFFAQHLMDYDAASNILSWQWSAGTGVDPQPYFRIFNPYVQAKKYDPAGTYIRRWVKELADVETTLLHDESRRASHPLPGYPQPIVDYRESSQQALHYFKQSLA